MIGLPAAFDLRGGKRWGHLTLRTGLGVEAGGRSAHAPLRIGVALLADLEATQRFGFFGVELDGDGARAHPAVAALNLVFNLTSLKVQFALGVATPVALGASSNEPSFGVFVRIFYLSEREQEYGEAHPAAAASPRFAPVSSGSAR